MAYGISGGSMTAIQQTIDSLVGRYFPIESRAAYAKTVLAQLALNMALNGKASEDNATTIAAWLFHVRYRPCNVSPRSKVSEIELANQIRSDALKAGLLLQTASGIGFVSPEFQNVFSVICCQQQGLSPRLVRLLAKPKLAHIWQIWADIDHTLATQLMNLAQSYGRHTRFRAIKVLGFIGSSEVVPFLLSLLEDVSPGVRWQSAVALGKIRDESAAIPLVLLLSDPIREVRWQASEALGNLGHSAINAMLPQFSTDSDEMRWRLRSAIQKIGDWGSAALVHLLYDDNPVVRYNATFCFQWLNYAESIDPLTQLTTDMDPRVRASAVAALGHQQSPNTLVALTKALRDANPDVRRQGAMALGQLASSAAVDPLLGLLEDEDSGVRVVAISSLGRLRDQRVVRPLIEALKDPSISNAAALALADLGNPEAIEPLVAVLGKCANALAAVSRFEKKLVAQAILSVIDPAPTQEYMHMLFALGDTGDPRAVNILLEASKDPRPEIRAAIPYRLSYFNDPRVSPRLLEMLEDDSGDVRYLAVHSLGRLRNKQAVAPIVRLLKDPVRQVRLFSIWALQELADSASVPALMNAVSDEDAYVRSAAARALGDLGDRNILRLLQKRQSLEPDLAVRRQINWAIKSVAEHF